MKRFPRLKLDLLMDKLGCAEKTTIYDLIHTIIMELFSEVKDYVPRLIGARHGQNYMRQFDCIQL